MSTPVERGLLQDIIAGFLNGETRQFIAIKRRIIGFVNRRYFAQALDREDLVAEILRILFHNLQDGQFRGDNVKALNAYIYQISRRQIGRAIEQSQKDPQRLTEAGDPEANPGKAENPGRRAADRDCVEKIYAALDPKCRELLLLKFQREWSDQEIADYQAKSKNAVSTAISRCLKKAQDLKLVKELLYENNKIRH